MTVASFTAEVGPQVPVSNDPLEMFSHFFNHELLQLIVKETNRYADQCKELEGRQEEWKTTEEEIKAYFGFQILMGINVLPEMRDYWSKDEKLHYSPVASKISRDRFEEISRYLHFANNATLPGRLEEGYSRLQKVDPVIQAVRNRCLNLYQPHRENAIDEAMVPFKGIANNNNNNK